MKFSEGKIKMNEVKKETMPERSRMNTKYANLMLFRLLEVLYDSKGKGAKFRTCILGKEDIVDQYKDEGLQFSESSWEENRDRCRAFLREQDIIEDLSCNIEQNEAEIIIQACIHIPMEEMLKNEEVPPYTCIPANLFAYGMENATGKQTEIAKIETGENACKIKILLFQEED
jgi:hypothetical protein